MNYPSHFSWLLAFPLFRELFCVRHVFLFILIVVLRYFPTRCLDVLALIFYPSRELSLNGLNQKQGTV